VGRRRLPRRHPLHRRRRAHLPGGARARHGKDVNDRHGHQVGDDVLVAVADRLRGCVRAADVAARLGGDEFAVLVGQARSALEVLGVAERILEALRRPVELASGALAPPQGSIGVAIADPSCLGADELLRRADVAMYAAKARGKGIAGIYEDSLEESLVRHAAPERPRLVAARS